jgi:hypothetical protein
MKIYKKRGNKNYKERKMLAELEPILKKKFEQDPNFKIVTATTPEELKTLYNKHVVSQIDEVDYVEYDDSENIENETKSSKENMSSKDTAELEDEVVTKSSKDTSESNNPFIDPLNRKEPIVRDYVFGDQSMSKNGNQPKDLRTEFAEPTDFDEAFVIPDDEEEDDNKSNKTSSKSTEKTQVKSSAKESKEPLNPHWDEMKGSVQKKKTKKFAKYIVEAVSTLQQKGFVYFANKDINEAKLNEYELEGVMDLSLLVSLEDGQEVTVKQFFQHQCTKAEQMSHLTREQKEDITESLTEVLMEKGAGPTPTQELLLVTLTILGGQALTLMTLKSQTNSLLDQLRAMNSDNQAEQGYEEPWHQQKTEMTDVETNNNYEEQKQETQESFEQFSEPQTTEQEVLPEITATPQIGETIETKE